MWTRNPILKVSQSNMPPSPPQEHSMWWIILEFQYEGGGDRDRIRWTRSCSWGYLFYIMLLLSWTQKFISYNKGAREFLSALASKSNLRSSIIVQQLANLQLHNSASVTYIKKTWEKWLWKTWFWILQQGAGCSCNNNKPFHVLITQEKYGTNFYKQWHVTFMYRYCNQ